MAQELQEVYEAGMSIRALAEWTGRSYGFVHRLLGEAGVRLRARGGPNRGRVPKVAVQAGARDAA